MKQKVMIIAALLHDPDVLILDEPDSGLDVTATLVLRHLITTLARRGKAVLYSSHVLDLVEKTCDRVIVIHRGKVVADNTVGALRDLMSSGSFEEVFAQLVLRDDPARTLPTSPTSWSIMRDRLLVRALSLALSRARSRVAEFRSTYGAVGRRRRACRASACSSPFWWRGNINCPQNAARYRGDV